MLFQRIKICGEVSKISPGSKKKNAQELSTTWATRSPERIRTAVSALRGLRARPLHNGARDTRLRNLLSLQKTVTQACPLGY